MRTLAVLFAVLLAGQAVAATPEERYATADAALKQQCEDVCGFGDYDTSEMKALDALWDATQDWTVALLEANPEIGEKKLSAALRRRHPRHADSVAPVSATRLAPDLFAFSARWGESGNVFLGAKRDGQWSVVWDVRKAEPGHFATLRAWRTDRAVADCSNTEGHDGHFDCGPLYGDAFALTPDVQGHVRFGLLATFAQGAGFTVTSQVSFWRWDGRTAQPLLAETYHHELDDAASGGTADTVVVRVKDRYKSFDACGACVGRQLDWTFRILPDGIVDEGKKPVSPEADTIDGVYDRLSNHQPVKGTASPAVLALMTSNIPDGLGNFATRRGRTGALVCLDADSFDAFFLRFRVSRGASGFYIDKAERLPAANLDKLCYQPKGK